jgi:exopolysaccharide biosynthesis polyprenyl glycosylphosphotransferase
MHGSLDKLAPGFHGKVTLLVDLFLVVVAALLSTAWLESSAFSPMTPLVFMAVIGWVIAASVLRLYSPHAPRSISVSVLMATMGILILGLFLGAMDWLLSQGAARPFNLVQFTILLFSGVLSTQLLLYRPLREHAKPMEKVLVVGTGALGVTTYRRLLEGGARGKNIVGFLRFDGDPLSLPAGIIAPVLGCAEDLLKTVEARPVSEVFLAGRVMEHGFQMQEVVRTCEELGLPFAVPAHSFKLNRAKLLQGFDHDLDDGYLHYLSTESKPVQWAVKRMLDLLCASLALIVLSPLLLGVAFAIRFESKGPILFKQVRVGLHGAHFDFLKFRSMVVNADDLKDTLLKQNEMSGPVFKMKNDPRITRVGRFIRKYSIDELPQLINILRGDMTIVGPRPPVPREVASYKPWQRRRLSVRPGLTCYWQVGGRNEIGFEEWMLLDLRYVDHWNLWRDIELIAKTVPVVVTGRGAS